MRAYREVPHWWYFTMLGVNLAAATLMVWTTPLLQTPVWALLLALVIAAVSSNSPIAELTPRSSSSRMLSSTPLT